MPSICASAHSSIFCLSVGPRKRDEDVLAKHTLKEKLELEREEQAQKTERLRKLRQAGPYETALHGRRLPTNLPPIAPACPQGPRPPTS